MNNIDRTIIAGYKAIERLKSAKNDLDSAKNWGVVDILGGGFIISMVKHSKMNNAKEAIHDAEDAIRVFNNHLMSLNLYKINIDTNDLLGVLDVFLDGLFFDLFMQSRINEAIEAVDNAIEMISRAVQELEKHRY